MTVAEASLFRYRLKLKQPLMLSTGALEVREGLLVKGIDADGMEGWGDAAPLPGFSKETLEKVSDAAQQLLPNFEAGDIPDELPSLSFARDTALGMLEGAKIGESSTQQLPLNGLLARNVSLEDEQLAYPALKVKIGADPMEDAQRVLAICKEVSADTALRLDANRAWSMDQLKTFAQQIDVSRIAYIEEPLIDGLGLDQVFSQTGLAMAWDETLLERSPEHVEFDEGLVAIIIKPTLLGSLEKIAAWSAAAEMQGIQRVFGSCFESGVGHWSIARLALAFAGDCPAGLDTHRAFERDVIQPRLSAVEGNLQVVRPFGLGHKLRMESLEEVASWRA